MKQAYLVNGLRTAIGNFGGTLSTIRTDDLAAFALNQLMKNRSFGMSNTQNTSAADNWQDDPRQA